MDEEQVDAVLAALAQSSRRRMLDLIQMAPGMSVGALASHFEMSRIGVQKHLKVLEEVELVISRKRGRTRELFFNPVPIQLLHDRWTNQYSQFWAGRMVDVKARIERRAIEDEENHRA